MNGAPGPASDRIAVDWIAVDWGGSHLRAWAMTGDGPIAHAANDCGTGGLRADQFGPALVALVGDWLADGRCIPAYACGMLGSRQGWVEAPYRTVPCTPLGDGLVVAPHGDPRVQVHVVPGLKQTAPADVMRGEETQIAGFLSLNQKFDGVICLPGTHTKWVHISAGEIVSFRTFMTGELFALLSQQSVLRHTVAGDGWDAEAFTDAVSTGMSNAAELAARLFSIRAEGLLNDLHADQARARLSGLLIGAELTAARPYWLGQHVALIGDDKLCKAYSDALGAQGLPVERTDADRMTLEGLKAAYSALKETTQ